MIDVETYARARQLDARAIELILAEVYPRVHRLAHALVGRAEGGRKIVRAIMHRGMAQVPRWSREGDAERWFLHHTVLLSRTMQQIEVDPGEDVLVRAEAEASPQYAAFVRALRKLAHQPREAVVLHDAEKVDARLLAVAMDCSTEAAANHLATGRRELQSVVGGELEVLLAQLARAYQALTPQESLALPMLKRTARAYVWPRRLWRVIRAVLVIAALAGLGYALWRYGPLLDY